MSEKDVLLKMVEFVDLRNQAEAMREEVERSFRDIIDRASFVSGKYVKSFEEAFASYVWVKHCIGVGSGTEALIVALMAIDLKWGDEVIVPVNTFIATAEAVSILGGRPVFVDIDPRTYTLDVAQVESKITSKTKAVIPVHLYGQCVDMDPLIEVACKYGLWVIEDASQAHGAEYKGRKAGSMGDIGCFSFYPSKNLGAWGEAGAVVTDNDSLAERLYKLRNHGGLRKYEHDIIGGNFRMDEFQAAVLLSKLRFLDRWNEYRREIAEIYKSYLHDLENQRVLKLPYEAPCNRHVYHLFVVRLKKQREEVMECLKEKGISFSVHYPCPLHLVKAYEGLGYKKGDFPVAEEVSQEIISLPVGIHVRVKDVHKIKVILGRTFKLS